jgi:hypothetical protein
MRIRVIIFISIIVSYSFGQNQYTSPYKFSEDILLNKDSATAYRIPWELSYISEYTEMLKSWDQNERKAPGLDSNLLRHFALFKPVNAKDFIKEKAKTEQIIIINEAHQQPYHRAFTASLLEDLYEQGFRYFGAETLAKYDMGRLNFSKYPIENSGYYTHEPLYGNLIREALKVGFEVFAYETERMGNSDSAGINLREIDQARNIKKVLDKDPKAKILVHCGFDHLVETPYLGWGKAMAGRLIEYTGINPYTIDQTRLTERSASDYENPYFKKMDYSDYTMLIDSSGKAFNGPPTNKEYDARVYHPRTRFENGRPHWIFDGDRLAFFPNEKITIDYPCLVFAFIEGEAFGLNETSNAIPLDIIELKNKDEEKALSLKKGNYNILVKNRKSEIQKFKLKFQ